MYRKKMMTFLLALFMVAMSIGPVSAEGLLDPPIITMTIVGDYVFSNDIPDPYCQSLNGLFYDGKSLTASDFSILEPQEQYPDDRRYLRIPLSHGKQDGTVAIKFTALGYGDTMTTFTFPVDPDPQSHPSAPELLSYSAGSATEAGIVWKSTSKWNASSYVIFRKLPGGNFTAIGKVNGTTLFYTDAGLNPDQEYIYAVQMTSVDGVLSDLSKEMSVKLVKDPDPANAPLPPTLLKAEALSDMEVKITWKANSKWDVQIYNVFRKQPGGTFKLAKTVDGTQSSVVDSGLEPNKEYIYHVDMMNVNGYHSYSSNELSVTTKAKTATITPPPAVTQPVVTPPVISPPVQPQQPQTPAVGKKVIRFYVGSSEYYIDNKLNTMDTAPIVSGGRTLLPIAYATAPLGATVDWNASEQKVTVKTATKTIELWTGTNTAKINGVATLIDPGNTAVQPVILPPGRTMLPLRFVTENLGCDLEWNPSTKEVKITAK